MYTIYIVLHCVCQNRIGYVWSPISLKKQVISFFVSVVGNFRSDKKVCEYFLDFQKNALKITYCIAFIKWPLKTIFYLFENSIWHYTASSKNQRSNLVIEIKKVWSKIKMVSRVKSVSGHISSLIWCAES